ncbi:MAG: YggS family pyridoxal phosphate-dependent enzyme [Desulfitobacteriaceae bacterium]|nr:YggS family pyridoxal phosphate-dependent enzyme [Desulfitobacteriaceae bacterium]MDD4346188.1 YggS family pyridoxal phosphate-dependent enzyme [Desulfitobacteriaceae bacterium]MDD4401173.1 YggS family pyridoxal phosphate-dependent enzyme [Desulfitobacteriaceae bacterium]
MEIAHKLNKINQRIYQAATKAGRDPRKVKLLAVSKTIPAAVLLEAYKAGQQDFAENRVQEWLNKVPELPADCYWHIIGRLQTNKVKYLDQRVSLIHSLDRLALLKRLEEHGARRDLVWPVLVQVNIARDDAKTGLLREEVADFLIEALNYPHIRVNGLMTIGLFEADIQETRGFFRDLRRLRDDLKKEFPKEFTLNELSMGMSQDFEIAIEEGATIVRVGREIFGER